MKLLFDSSSIINLCAKSRIGRLLEGSTLSLAFYEVGNAIWKQVHLHGALTPEEGHSALGAVAEVLSRMGEVLVKDAPAILDIAVRDGVTYYDASYIRAAIQGDKVLVTDDERLRSAAGKYVETMTSGEIDQS